MRLGDAVPEFNLPGVGGENVSSGDFSASNVLAVIFGCNHCPYVKAYIDRIISLQDRYGGDGLSLVMINSNNEKTHPDDSFENMKKNAVERGFNFPYLRDETAKTARAFEAKYTPEVFLFDGERHLRYTGRIDDCWHSVKGVKRHDLEEAVKDILDHREVAVKMTPPIGCTIKWP